MKLFIITFFSLLIFVFIISFAFKHKFQANVLWNDNVTRPLDGTTFTPSTGRNCRLYYTISIATTATICGAASCTLKLQYSNDGGSTWEDGPTIGLNNTVTLAAVINNVITNTYVLSFEAEAGTLFKFIKTTSGTVTTTWINGREGFYE